VRAYTAAASGALQSAELVSMRLVVDCKVRVSYAQFEQAQRIIAAAETRLDEPIFDDAVTLCWRMPAGREEALRTALNELTRGGAEVEISAPQYAAF
jgi:IMPACT family protein